MRRLLCGKVTPKCIQNACPGRESCQTTREQWQTCSIPYISTKYAHIHQHHVPSIQTAPTRLLCIHTYICNIHIYICKNDHRLIRRELGVLVHSHSVCRNDPVSVRYTNTGTEGTGPGLSAKGDSDPFCGVCQPRMFRQVRSEELRQMDIHPCQAPYS